MKTKLIICIILLFCIVISSVGCFEQYKFWKSLSVISDPSRVWVDDEHNIWFVFNEYNSEFYGQIVIDSNTYNFHVGNRPRSGCVMFRNFSREPNNINIYTFGKYYGDKLILTVDNSNCQAIPKGTKLVFKPYPRQAEHYLPK